ncbi:MAG: glutaredoxin [archaeon]
MSKLIIYTRPGCPYCQKLKSILNERKIGYTDFNVTDGSAPRMVVDKNGHIPVPQVDINGRIIYDYKTEESLVDEISKLI